MKQLSFADTLPASPPLPPSGKRDRSGRFIRGVAPTRSAEIATIEKADPLSGLWFSTNEFPNPSAIVRDRSRGQGLRVYEQMWQTDADLQGLFLVLFDAVLHYQRVWRPAGDEPKYKEHARFLEVVTSMIPHRQNALRHMLDAYPRGFSVTEKMYGVLTTGEFAGARVWTDLLDKPQHWFSFDKDRRLRFRTLANPYPGELVDQDKFIVVTYGSNSNPWGRPVLDGCYFPWMIRHQLIRDEAIYYDKWASPTVVTEYDWQPGDDGATSVTNEKNRNEALRVGQTVQGDQTIAIAKGMTVRLLESVRNGSVSYLEAIGQFWEMLSRLITGQILAGSGSEGGSYALGIVHAEAIANKVDMLASWISAAYSRECRELIDDNYGPQDLYPRMEIRSRSLAQKQAYLAVEAAALATGHDISKRDSDDFLQTVLPEDEADALKTQLPIAPGQAIPAPASTLT